MNTKISLNVFKIMLENYPHDPRMYLLYFVCKLFQFAANEKKGRKKEWKGIYGVDTYLENLSIIAVWVIC